MSNDDQGTRHRGTGIPAYAEVQQDMQTRLAAQRAQKRLNPVLQPWASGTIKQFPITPS